MSERASDGGASVRVSERASKRESEHRSERVSIGFILNLFSLRHWDISSEYHLNSESTEILFQL